MANHNDPIQNLMEFFVKVTIGSLVLAGFIWSCHYAWGQEAPAPGTPESIRATLVRATEMGITFTPTRINQTTQMRDSSNSKPVPRFNERRPSPPVLVQPAPAVLRRASFVCTRSQEAGGK
jgi:hypothetical protein